MLTSDAPLVLQARADAILATFPWSIVVQFDGANAADILRIVPPDRKTGSIFARTTPGGWLGLRNVGTFTVVDIEHVGRLAFDTAGLEWTFSCSFGLTVRLPYVETARGTTVVSVSYNLRRSGVRGQVVLRAARFGGLERPTISETTLGIHTRPAGRINVGTNLQSTSSWNGYIRHLSIGPETMSPDTWKGMAELEDGAPNPLNHNILDRALLNIQHQMQ
jgi:hypothetical protein